jgi:cell fate regulator YaaT (PSP1 superfamily)
MDNTPQSDESEEQPNSDRSQAKKKNFKIHDRDEITEENCRFTEGEILKFVRVRFPGHAKSYAFLVGSRNLMYGQKVMAMSDRGIAVGYINSFEYSVPFNKNLLPIKSINKIATEEDITKENETYKRQKEIETICQDLITKHKLQMNLTHVEFTQFGKKVVFYFIAPARVDFRGLVRDLVGELKLRIELRQISVRDRAASMGAIGPCGRELCCSSFLAKYGNVSIKMAKNQNLTLNYSKLNGVCGQLKCCLSYEEEVYEQKRKRLPNEGDFIQVKTGESGKVHKLNILSEQFDLLTDKGKIRRYTSDQQKKKYTSAEYKFPHRFDNISDETATIVGLDAAEAIKSKQFQRDMEKINKRAFNFANEKIEEISEFLPERDRSTDPVKTFETKEPEKDFIFKAELKSNIASVEVIPEEVVTTQKVREVEEASADSTEQKTSKKPHNKNKRYNNKNKNRNTNQKSKDSKE